MLKTFSGRTASQNEFEINSFIKLLKDEKASSYLEIGARHGDTFHHVMTSLPVGSHGVAVDLPGGLWGAKKAERSLRLVCDDLVSRGYMIDLILGDSTSKKVVDKVSAFESFDAMLIDGDHTYEGVEKDWINYNHLSKIVAFHDIVGAGQKEKVFGNKVEVPLFWQHLLETHSFYQEFVDKESKMGIGVIFKK